jgi:Outer membrane lipoprotein-sorting protein
MNRYPHRDTSHRFHCRRSAVILFAIGIPFLLLSVACGSKLEGSVTHGNENSSPAGVPTPVIDAAPIIERYRSLADSRDSTIKMRATISAASGGADSGAPKQVLLTMYRKHEPDGRLLFLAEFTAPTEERDRDGLITAFPDGRIEGVRYVQSTDSFIVTSDLMSEDALFGMTLQELVDGQPERYDFTITGEETSQGIACYRAEGKLKDAAESKFLRVVLLIAKQTGAAVQAEFYDNHDQLARKLAVTRTEQKDGRWTRMRWTIDNPGRGKQIEFEVVDVGYDQNLKDDIFTREHLKKIASR